jgi:signal peptidase II
MVNLKFLFGIVALIVVGLDQSTKLLVDVYRPVLESGFLTIHYVTNTGASFGIFQNGVVWLAGISLAATIGVLWYYPRIEQEIVPQIMWGILLGGIIGNLLDRVTRHFVIDFIDLGFWPAFNVADSAIVVSSIWLVFYYWKK